MASYSAHLLLLKIFHVKSRVPQKFFSVENLLNIMP